MRKSRFSEEEIIRVLQEVDSGRKVKEVCREQVTVLLGVDGAAR